MKLKETDFGFIATLDVTGYKREQIHISIVGNNLQVKGESKKCVAVYFVR